MSDQNPDHAAEQQVDEQAIEALFWQMAEECLQLANDKGQSNDPGVVSEAMMYSAARFATFVMAVNSESKEDFVEDRSEYFKHLAGRFRDFLDDSFDDYGENYAELLGRKNNDE